MLPAGRQEPRPHRRQGRSPRLRHRMVRLSIALRFRRAPADFLPAGTFLTPSSPRSAPASRTRTPRPAASSSTAPSSSSTPPSSSSRRTACPKAAPSCSASPTSSSRRCGNCTPRSSSRPSSAYRPRASRRRRRQARAVRRRSTRWSAHSWRSSRCATFCCTATATRAHETSPRCVLALLASPMLFC